MTQTDAQVPWTADQWARVRQVIVDEASRARIAAKFLALDGPLPADTDFVAKNVLFYEGNGQSRMMIDDRSTIQLATLQVKVYARGAQIADPALESVTQLFRRAANVLARLEDAMIFRGQSDSSRGPDGGMEGMPPVWEVLGGQRSEGLYSAARERVSVPVGDHSHGRGADLVTAVSRSIGLLEERGQLGPFALVLGQTYFEDVQSPDKDSLVLPQDRIIPFLGGGSLVRSSTLRPDSGVIVALGGAPVELVVATDVSLQFLQITTDPLYVFRVYEKIVLRIKEAEAIVALGPEHGHAPKKE